MGQRPAPDPVRLAPSALITHLDDAYMAVPADTWVADPGSTEMMSTFTYNNVRHCVSMDGHEVMRSRLQFVGTFTGTQCQDGDGPTSAWVIVRRLL